MVKRKLVGQATDHLPVQHADFNTERGNTWRATCDFVACTGNLPLYYIPDLQAYLSVSSLYVTVRSIHVAILKDSVIAMAHNWQPEPSVTLIQM